MPFGYPKDGTEAYWNAMFEAIDGTRKVAASRGFKLNFLRANLNESDLNLTQSVVNLIKRSHITIGVITGHNPNVFWELGFSRALEKPVVLVVAKDVEEKAPVLVAELLRLPYEPDLFKEAPFSEADVMELQGRILSRLSMAVDVVRGRTKPVTFEIFTERDDAHLPDAVYGAQRTIDLITSNLYFFTDEEHFVSHGQYAFDDPVQRGVKVRILALNPDSVIAEYRARELGREHDVSGYREDLRNAARFIYHRYRDAKHVDIRIYDDLPLQITLRTDWDVFTAIVSRGQQARFNLHLKAHVDYPGVRPTFESHFSEVHADLGRTRDISAFKWAQ